MAAYVEVDSASMKTDELREAYLAFFESKGCTRRPSDVLVPRGDPTVLFTPAGMNQFKREFLGLGDPAFKRATTCQKCLRTGDIENVGKTAYHHTFFEMLGNFSFGDYFKREAIQWAWEFCTSPQWLGLSPDRLTVSVYLDDDEAAGIWQHEVGLPPSRIERMGEDDNFWPAGAPSKGPDGVCGPCSEIFYHPGGGGSVEIWNLVFTQFNRQGPPPGNLHPLPSKNIDTGMGLERTAAVLQGVASNFDTDGFLPILSAICDILGRKYDRAHADSVRIRRIADHVRAVTFCVHENVFPSNAKQGYVVRRLLRRAVLDGYRLGLRDPFLHRLTHTVAAVAQRPYPELHDTAERVSHIVRLEEEKFLSTLESGIGYLEDAVRHLERSGNDSLGGRAAFDLHTTHGFPIELTESLLAERNLKVDRPEYDRLWAEHVLLSGSEAFSGDVFATGPIDALKKTHAGTEFLGYHTTEADGVVIGIIAQNELVEDVIEVGHQDPITLVLDRSPFYGEAGGQVGDTGELRGERFRFRVSDTHRERDFVLHVGHVTAGEVRLGDRLTASVDASRRAGIRRAHSATHLLHHALRQTLGGHATQAGSKVDDDYLRFDFTHPEAVRGDELSRIEDEINARITDAAPVRWEQMPIAQAKQLGAMALFGEKYGDVVRVVSIGDFSREFCGGTHLDNTGQVGLCRIVSEESVAAGTRRIVALTGRAALRHVREQEARLHELATLLKAAPAELPRRTQSLLDEIRALKKQLTQRQTEAARTSIEHVLASATELSGVKVIARELPQMTADDLRQQIDMLRRKAPSLAVLLVSQADGKLQLVAGLSRDLVERGLHAGQWVKAVAAVVGGGGGGKPDMAQAGGKDVQKLPEALKAAVDYVAQRLGA
jgi:alanyl-tRNA synthetase